MGFWAKVLLATLLSLMAGAARAQVYRYVDSATGSFIYSNQKSDLPVLSRMSAPSPLRCASVSPLASGQVRSASKKTVAAGLAPAAFPRVSSAAQREYDSDRRRILQEELELEKSALNDAIGKGASEDIVHRHQANVAALERELDRTQ